VLVRLRSDLPIRKPRLQATTSAPSTARPSTGTTSGSVTPPCRRDNLLGGADPRRLPAGHDGGRRGGPFYYAEPYHQQYLAANPNGYCGLGGTGVSCPVPSGITTQI
jgi:Peptide methionine sulfoxide reductase